MLKPHTSRDGFVEFGVGNMFTTSHNERHILLQLPSQIFECVSLPKKHIARLSGTCLFHWTTPKLLTSTTPLLAISIPKLLLLFQQLKMVTACLCFVDILCLVLDVQHAKPVRCV